MNFTFVAGLLEIEWKKSIDIASFLNTRAWLRATLQALRALLLTQIRWRPHLHDFSDRAHAVSLAVEERTKKKPKEF